MAYIEAKNYRYGYNDAKNVLNIDSLSIDKSELVLLIGASGCGKTTFLRRIADMTGYKGIASGELNVSAHSYGYVWQDPSAQMVCDRVEHEIVFGMENNGYEYKDMRRRLAEVSVYFGIEGLIHRETYTLSSGEKQLVNIAAAMALKPDLMLLDEITSSLDPYAAQRIEAILRKLHKDTDTTIILAEQRYDLFLDIADKVIYMNKGEISYIGDVSGFLHMEHELIYDGLPSDEDIANSSMDYLAITSDNNISNPAITSDKNERPTTIITAKDIYFRYAKSLPDVIKELKLTVYKGMTTALVGGNGSGKTTLAKIIAGYIKPYRGKVIRGSESISYLPSDCKYILSYDTISEQLRAASGRAVEYMKRLYPDYDDSRHPLDISGGETERVGIAYTLGKKADIYLLDEPTKGLDVRSKYVLTQIIREINTSGGTVIIITHDIEFASRVSDYMGMLFDREVVVCEEKEKFLSGNIFYTA